jgi:hypothetical protein
MTLRRKAGQPPLSEDVKAARERVGHKPEHMAQALHKRPKTVSSWETRTRTMPPADYEFYLLQTGQYQVEALRAGTTPKGEAVLTLLLRLDDGRRLNVWVRPAELAKISTRQGER